MDRRKNNPRRHRVSRRRLIHQKQCAKNHTDLSQNENGALDNQRPKRDADRYDKYNPHPHRPFLIARLLNTSSIENRGPNGGWMDFGWKWVAHTN